MRAFIDLTAITGDRGQEALEALMAAEPALSTGDLTVLVTEGRSTEGPVGANIIEVHDGDALVAHREVVAALEAFLEGLGTEPGRVASVQPVVEYALLQTAHDSSQVAYIDLRRVLSAKNALSAWPDEIMPLDEAFTSLRRAINRRGGRVKMTQLRHALTAVDPRFTKMRGGKRPVDNPKLMGKLVREAEQAGVVRTSGHEQDPDIELAGVPTTKPEVQNASVARPASAPTPASESSSHSAPSFERKSDEYLHTLRAGNLGPFQEVRTAIYDEVENRLKAAGEPIAVGELLDDAVAAVRNRIEEARSEGKDYLLKNGRNLPWGRVRAFVGFLFMRRPVLMNGGSPVPATWANLTQVVDSIEEDWSLILDGELVVHLLSSGCTIDAYCEEDLSGALYDTRSNLERVRATLAHLLQSQRVGYDDRYALVLRERA